MNSSHNLICLLGPTATGKTKLAAGLAADFNGEIISADSRQVYRRMDLGTGKDYDDYIVNGKQISYHLIDILDPSEEFNLFLFKKYFYDYFNEITAREKLPFLAGGTGLYLHSILKDYNLKRADFSDSQIEGLNGMQVDQLREMLLSLNPALHNTTDLIDKERIIKAIIISRSAGKKNEHKSRLRILTLGVLLERDEIKKRITTRLSERLKAGMVDEVKALLDSGITIEKLIFFGLEYKYIGIYLKGELNYNDMFQKLNSAIHTFAKKQMTWFRKMEKEGIKIHWLNGPDHQTASDLISSFLENDS